MTEPVYTVRWTETALKLARGAGVSREGDGDGERARHQGDGEEEPPGVAEVVLEEAGDEEGGGRRHRARNERARVLVPLGDARERPHRHAEERPPDRDPRGETGDAALHGDLERRVVQVARRAAERLRWRPEGIEPLDPSRADPGDRVGLDET